MRHVNNYSNDWQSEMRNAYRSVEDLEKAGYLSTKEAAQLKEVGKLYSILLTPYFASLIDKNNPLCPIRLQSIPQIEEWEESQELKADPLTDLKHQPAPKITHRYPNRALLHLTTLCSMYCRYCFRKSLLNDLKEDFLNGEITKSFEYLEAHKEIEEVILSGGDPLMVSDANLFEVLNKLSHMAHIKRLRIHTRVPVTCPMRVTEELISKLKQIQKPLVFVLHFNHPKEITKEVVNAIEKLKTATSFLFNQSVLLPQINDDADVLKKLSETLFDLGITPYYLHHPDKARGTKHYQLGKQKGLEIYDALKKKMPGYLVPRYVIDNPDLPYKRLIS